MPPFEDEIKSQINQNKFRDVNKFSKFPVFMFLKSFFFATQVGANKDGRASKNDDDKNRFSCRKNFENVKDFKRKDTNDKY